MDLLARRFAESLFNKDCTIFTSPYIKNNVIILMEFQEEKIYFEIFKYVFDPKEPEILFCKEISSSQIIKSIMGFDIKIDFILPGKSLNEIVIFSQNGEVWKGNIRNNDLIIKECIGKIFLQENENISVFDIFNPIDLAVYFTKKTKDFACLVIKEKSNFFLALNILLFSQINADNSILHFEDSVVFWNSASENLDLFSYNEDSGLAYINFPQNKINNPIPISIKNLKKINNKPIDVCCIDDTVYALDEENLYIFPNFKKYKTLKKIQFSLDFDLGWFEPQYERCNLIFRNTLYNFIITPIMDNIILNKIKIEYNNMSSEDFFVDKEFQLNTLGNKQICILTKQNSSFAIIKPKYIDNSRDSYITIFKFKSQIPDAIESLQKLKELNLINLDYLSIITREKLPKGLISLNRRIRRPYTREEDIFIIENAYLNLSINDIAKELKRNPTSIYLHIKTNFGTPFCEQHSSFQRDCKDCINTRKKWVEESRAIIQKKEYHVIVEDYKSYGEIDFEGYVKRCKKRVIRKKTSLFKNILSSDLYERIIDFIVDADLARGRSIIKLFEQSILLFLDDYLRNLDILKLDISPELLKLYFNIKPDMKLLRHLILKYKEIINKEYYSLGDLKFFYKDLLILQKLYEPNVIRNVIPYIYIFYNALRKHAKKNVKEAYFPGMLYIFSKYNNRTITQKQLSELSGITEVTIRSRVKELEILVQNKHFSNILGKIREFICKNLTIQESIEQEKEKLQNYSHKINRLIELKDIYKIIDILKELGIKWVEKTSYIIIPSLEKLSTIEDNSLIETIINFLIKNNIKNEIIFDNYIKYIISENSKIVLKMIYYFYPEFEGLDLFSILKNLKINHKQKILEYIKESEERTKRFQSLMNLIKIELKKSNYS
ncbi:MAG: hypothetical protein ACTSPQ_09960 [Candidatus Helarchaeota archaeon]